MARQIRVTAPVPRPLDSGADSAVAAAAPCLRAVRGVDAVVVARAFFDRVAAVRVRLDRERRHRGGAGPYRCRLAPGTGARRTGRAPGAHARLVGAAWLKEMDGRASTACPVDGLPVHPAGEVRACPHLPDLQLVAIGEGGGHVIRAQVRWRFPSHLDVAGRAAHRLDYRCLGHQFGEPDGDSVAF